MRPPGQERRISSGPDGGFALLIVLWGLVLVSLLFTMLAAATRSDAQRAANLRVAAELEAAADGAIHTALFDLLQPGTALRDSPPIAAPPPDMEVAVEVVSQSGLVNPNVVSPDLMRALLLRLGADPAQARGVADAIAAWQVPDDRETRNGAKAARYRAAGLDYGPPGAPFETLDELGGVLGMTPALLSALAPYLTLYSDSEPDPALADPVVGAALRDLGAGGQASRARPRVFRITATVQRIGGARMVRSAVVRIGFSPSRRRWRFLAWDTLPFE